MKITTIGGILWVTAMVSPAWADDPPAPKGDFMSSLKQSFRHDYDHEVVRGHFDIGTPPESHRYYCLVDPKTGKAEANGIAGHPVQKSDGLTYIESAAVSFYSCNDAETKGLLITADYHAPPVVAPTRVKPHVAASAAAAAPAPANGTAAINTTDPLDTLQSFIDVYNSGDGTPLVALLGESADFVWVQPDGHTLWGHRAASEALQASRSSGSQLEFQSQDGHTISLSSKTAVIVTQLRLTQASQATHTIRCSSVLVQTAKGWRIVSLFMTPEVA